MGMRTLETIFRAVAPSRILSLAVILTTPLAASSQVGGTVFSVNAVGFANRTFKPGVSAAHNPLVAGDNRAAALFDHAPIGTSIHTPGPTGEFVKAERTASGWINGDLLLPPGRGFYVGNPEQEPFTITFVGNVLQGSLTNSLLPGTSLTGSLVPQEGLISTDLHFPPNIGVLVHVFNGTGPQANEYLFTSLGWLPHEPSLMVGDTMWVTTERGANWTRSFSVNHSYGANMAYGFTATPSLRAYPLNGGESAIYSVPGFALTPAALPELRLQFVGVETDDSQVYRVFTQPGRHYLVESSTDLQTWTTFTNFTADSSVFVFNTGRPTTACRFFRAGTSALSGP